VITLNFILDTGASEVNIPADVALTLYRAGTIQDADFLPGQTYKLADGSTVKSSRFILKSLKIGKSRVTNVPASIGNISSSLLLGQSFLEKLGAWGIDSQKQVLTIGVKPDKSVFTEKPVRPKAVVDLNTIFSNSDRLLYAGYEIEKSFSSMNNENPNLGESFTYIKKNGKTLFRIINDRAIGGIKSTQIGLFPLLGKDDKQLIISHHRQTYITILCCLVYKIYYLSSNIYQIFDDEEYNTKGELQPIDFEGKGKYHILRWVFSLEGLHGLCQLCSPHPEVIFSYDNKARRYTISSNKFDNYLLRNIDKTTNEFNELETKVNIYNKDENYTKWLAQILDISLNYIYAGREVDGWGFFNSRYKFPDKEEARSNIIYRLNNDPVYKAIYGR